MQSKSRELRNLRCLGRHKKKRSAASPFFSFFFWCVHVRSTGVVEGAVLCDKLERWLAYNKCRCCGPGNEFVDETDERFCDLEEQGGKKRVRERRGNRE